ncbi:MAG: YfhO family protein [Bacteroidota bacterium]|nr:YfhO family protein [Candidatus Kapabacteria bacterium]MDW8218957.1 YfhO family protein [Bacteroidota bacterium]
MTKQLRPSSKRSTQSRRRITSPQSLIPERYHTAIYIAILAASVLLFLRGTLFGSGVFFASDNIASGSFIPFLEAAKKSGEYPLWMPYIFSGLPSYAALLTTGERWWDIIMLVFNTLSRSFGALFGSDAARVGLFYILYGIGIYILMRSKAHSRFVAFFAAFSAIFSTFIIVWVVIGHNTKPMALMTFPYILLFLEKLRERFSLLFAVLLVIAVHILIESTHVQMVFYGLCCVSLYLLIEAINRLVNKQSVAGVARAAGVMIIAGGLSFAMAADRYLSVLEYTPYSTRGTAPIEKTAGQKQDESGGFDYEYATNWSFSPQEMITFLVPNYFGFGKMTINGEMQNTYWGQMPFTDAANYMGIGVLTLAIFGAWYWRRDTFVQFLVVMAVFALLLSFGKNMPLVYNMFFYGIPNFNKFRAPQMALALTQFAVPILAGYGITGILQQRSLNDQKRQRVIQQRWLVVGVGGAVLFLLIGFTFSIVGKEPYINAVSAATTEQYQAILTQVRDNPQQLAAYKERIAQLARERGKQIYQLMIDDWYTTALLGFFFMLAAWLLVRGTLSTAVAFVVFGILLAIDLWRVAVRPIEISSQRYEQTVFRKTDVISFLQQDTTLFRVADFSQAPNIMAYFGIQHVHGYHSAKLRVYQDLLDVAGKGGGSVIANPFLWNLMNVKYLVSERPILEGMQPVFKSQETPLLVYENPSVLPRAFFVNRVEVAPQIAILHHLRDGDFAPLELAYLEQPLTQPIDTIPGDIMEHINRVQLLKYNNQYIAFKVNASGNNFLFASEVYYPAGWRAYIDGKETPIFKTNYAFRGVIVPQGTHTVEMRFFSERFIIGKNISLACNLFVLALLGVSIWQWRKHDTLY